MNPDFSLQQYRFFLPAHRIAQAPAAKRGESRLMLLDRYGGGTRDAHFNDLPELLERPCLFVANNATVCPARFEGKRPGGGRAEVLLLTPLPLIQAERDPQGYSSAPVEALARPAKSCRPNDVVALGENFSLTILRKGDFGTMTGTLRWRGNLAEQASRWGQLPLPPYIKRPPSDSDAERYQVVYARQDKEGSIAAATAGLHFTPELRNRLEKNGHSWAEVTLYVGHGTFSPVRCNDIREHVMHSEYIDIPEETATAVCNAKASGQPVIAVGTTALRSLEAAFAATGGVNAFTGWSDIFLYPGRPINVADRLLTNFHLPESSLLMLVAAFAGRERILAAYAHAVEKEYRFFSYGDAMLIV